MKPTNKNDRAAWLQGPPAQCCPVPERAASPWRLVLLGAPGVGKGTQASLLNERFGACHLSTGDAFRAAVSRPQCAHSPAMSDAVEQMRSGALVADSTVWEMVRERSGCLHCRGGFILDGFPRTLEQAGKLHRFLKEEAISLNAVIDYQLPLDEIVARLNGRRICEQCKSIFHVEGNSAAPHCEHCGGRLYQREDDRPEAVAIRMKIYESSTAPLIDFYQNLGLLTPVDAGGPPEEIFARTLAALEGKH